MKNSKLHTTEDKSNEKVTSSNSKSEDTNFMQMIEGSERCLNGHPVVNKRMDGKPWECSDGGCEYSVTAYSSPSEPPQDTSLTEITAEYFMATDPDRVALQRKVLAWHKAERAKLFEQIRSELLDHFTIGAPSYNTANEAVKAQARQKVEGVMEALTRLEQK